MNTNDPNNFDEQDSRELRIRNEDERREKLHDKPSKSAWLEEIASIVRGQILKIKIEDGIILYIDRIIHSSRRPGLSRIKFNKALNEFLKDWNPEFPGIPAWQIARHLELIANYKPDSGWPTIINILSKGKPFKVYKDLEKEDISGEDLHLLTLRAALSYFPAPLGSPNKKKTFERTKSYKRYISILKKHLKETTLISYSPFAMYSLLHLNEYDLRKHKDKIIRTVLDYPPCIFEIITFYLPISGEITNLNELSYLFDMCLAHKDDSDIFGFFKEGMLYKQFEVDVEDKLLIDVVSEKSYDLLNSSYKDAVSETTEKQSQAIYTQGIAEQYASKDSIFEKSANALKEAINNEDV